MNKILIVARRELTTRICKKSFIILTVLMPFIFAAVIFVPLWLSSISSAETRDVVVIDHTGRYADVFVGDEGGYTFVAAGKADAKFLLEQEQVAAVVEISTDLDKPDAVAIISDKEIPLGLAETINGRINDRVRADKIASHNLEGLSSIIEDINTKHRATTIRIGNDGSTTESATGLASVVGMVFMILSYTFILVYGNMVMQSVLEEKTGRIVEIIVSSVRPYQLLAGKMIGIAVVGITQFVIWAGMFAAIISAAQMFVAGAGSATDTDEWSKAVLALGGFDFVEVISMFVVYFIGGYILFASLFAAIGSAVSSQNDAQQFAMPMTLLMMFALYAGIYSAENPDGPLALWCSFIPLTSPIVMMVRIPFGVPLWHELLSIALLYGTAVGIVWLSGQVYRVGIFLHGKKPSFAEMMKWITYK